MARSISHLFGKCPSEMAIHPHYLLTEFGVVLTYTVHTYRAHYLLAYLLT